MSQLNERQRAFARVLVLEGKSQKDAAIVAGYSPRVAESTGSALVRNPKVAAEIERLRERAEVHSAVVATMSREDVLQRLAALSEASESTTRDKIAALKLYSDIEGYAAPKQSERVTLHAQLPSGLDGIDRETLRRLAYPAARTRRVALDVVSEESEDEGEGVSKEGGAGTE
jgi:phage terminase small subunit